MATIKTAITLYDGMTAPLKRMQSQLLEMIDDFEAMQKATDEGFDTSKLDLMRAKIDKIGGCYSNAAIDIAKMTAEQEEYKSMLDASAQAADALTGALKKAATALVGISSIKELVGMSDKLTSTNTRLNLLVDDKGSVEDLEQKIMASAQRSRASYFDVADAVAKLGLNAGAAFGSNDEIIAFMEQVNKQFVIGGASAQEQSNAMVQLTQAMASGALRGEELNSILDAAPGIARAIEQYMGIAEGSIKDVASEGLVTADVVKNALFEVADEVDGTNERFNSMPMTWSQVFTSLGNIALQALTPILNGINLLANNLEIVIPIVAGVGAAFAVFQIAASWTKIASAATTIYTTVTTILSGVMGMLTMQAGAASTTLAGLNMIMYANPITWVVMLITLLIAALYAGVAVFNKFAGASVSATGIIGGALAVLAANAYNTFIVPMHNGFATLANFIGNVFNNPVAAVEVAFYDMCLTVIGYIRNLANTIEALLNKIPGVTVDVTSGLDSFYSGLEKAQQAVKDESGWTEYMETWDYMDLGDAAKAGYKLGEGISDKISGVFGFGSGGSGDDSGYDYGSMMSDKLDGINENAANTAANTAASADALEMAEEDIAYMKDIAEREAINRFTTAEVRIDQTNNNYISNDTDVDGIMDSWATSFADRMNISGEGVYA